MGLSDIGLSDMGQSDKGWSESLYELQGSLQLRAVRAGEPTTECSTTGQSNWPYRGSKSSVWEGGTKGTAFMYVVLVDVEPARGR